MEDIQKFLTMWHSSYGGKKIKTGELAMDKSLLFYLGESYKDAEAKSLGWKLKRIENIKYGSWKLIRHDATASVVQWRVIIVDDDVKQNIEEPILVTNSDIICTSFTKLDGSINFLINKKYKDEILYTNPSLYLQYMSEILKSVQDEIKQAEDVLGSGVCE